MYTYIHIYNSKAIARGLRRGHPPGRGRWYAPSSRHLRALLSAFGRCSFGVVFSSCACVCRCRGCCFLSVCVCVCVTC